MLDKERLPDQKIIQSSLLKGLKLVSKKSDEVNYFVTEVMNKINITMDVVYSSNLNPQFSSNEMLIDLLEKRKATTYLCGAGAGGYHKDELYTAKRIHVMYNSFVHPTYTQFNSKEFIKGLSIVDSLMNLGFEQTEKLVKAS